MLGTWSVESAREEFAREGFAVIDGFFAAETALEIAREFPCPRKDPDNWCEYKNPLEIKRARTDLRGLGIVEKTFEFLEGPACVRMIRDVTGLAIQTDPFRHGAGLHCHERGGKLDMHVDYSIHPISGKTRSVNLIAYVTPEWDPRWGGELILDGKEIAPAFNRAVVFRTDGVREAVHGMPTPLQCPEGITRNSLAIYYVRTCDPLHGVVRFKANFRPVAGDQETRARENPRYGKLYDIRSRRRIEEDDLWEGWERDPIGAGIWW